MVRTTKHKKTRGKRPIKEEWIVENIYVVLIWAYHMVPRTWLKGILLQRVNPSRCRRTIGRAFVAEDNWHLVGRNGECRRAERRCRSGDGRSLRYLDYRVQGITSVPRRQGPRKVVSRWQICILFDPAMERALREAFGGPRMQGGFIDFGPSTTT